MTVDPADHVGIALDRHEHPAAAIFCGVFDQVTEHFIQVLALDPDLCRPVAGDVHGDAFV